jgi:hypothetical protein
MTNQSKRAFLRGAAAAGAASIPAASALALPAEAALLALQPEIDAADQAWEVRARERSAAEAVYFARRPGAPEAPGLDGDMLMEVLRGRIGLEPGVAAAVDAYAEAMKAWREATERASAESGLPAAEEAQDAADDVRLAIRDKIAGARALSLDGLIFKARYAATHFPGDPDEDVMRSIVEDLLAMELGQC